MLRTAEEPGYWSLPLCIISVSHGEWSSVCLNSEDCPLIIPMEENLVNVKFLLDRSWRTIQTVQHCRQCEKRFSVECPIVCCMLDTCMCTFVWPSVYGMMISAQNTVEDVILSFFFETVSSYSNYASNFFRSNPVKRVGTSTVPHILQDLVRALKCTTVQPVNHMPTPIYQVVPSQYVQLNFSPGSFPMQMEGDSFGPTCQADEVLCYILTCCMYAQRAGSQIWLYIELLVSVAVL